MDEGRERSEAKPPRRGWTRRVDIIKLWPFIIFAIALTARFIFLNQFQNSPFFSPDVEGVDQSLYHKLAKFLAEGYWPGDKLLYGHPLYPYLVSFFYRAWGADNYSVVIAQLLMGSISSVLIYFIATYIFDFRVGLISSLIAALYGPFLFYEGMLMPNALAIFLNLGAVVMIFNILDMPNLRRTFLAGLLFGCSLATNSGVATFILILISWIILVLKNYKKTLLPHLACFALAVILPVFFLSLKHFVAEGHFDSFAAHGGINFYVGNNPDANGTFRAPLGFTPSAEGLSEDSSKYARQVLGEDLTAAQISEFWYQKAFSYIRAHPFAWFKLLSRKFLLFWNAVELGDVADYYLAKNDSIILKFNPFTFGLIAPLGLLGLGLATKARRAVFVLYAGVFGFMISCMLFFVNSRYRLSSLPFLIIFAGFAVVKIWERLKQKDLIRLGVYVVSLIVFFIFSNANIIVADTLTPLYNLSVIYEKRGFYDKAIEISRKLLGENTNLPAVHFNLGVCYYEKKMTREAILEFQETLRLNPNAGDAHFNLGMIYLEKKDYAKAIDEFKNSLTGSDKDLPVHYNLGRIYHQQGNFQKAQDEYTAALKIKPDAVQAKKALEEILKKARNRPKI